MPAIGADHIGALAAAPRQTWADLSLGEEVDVQVNREAVAPPGVGCSECPRIGVSLDGVVIRAHLNEGDLLTDFGPDQEAPGAIDGLRQVVKLFGRENVFLVGRARPGGLAQQKTERWLHETCHCCERTGVLRHNIVFCGSVSGQDGKGAAAERLKLSHVVDDSFRCLSSVFGNPDGNYARFVEEREGQLLHFVGPGASTGESADNAAVDPERMPLLMRRFYKPVENWDEVLHVLEEGLCVQYLDDEEGVAEPHSMGVGRPASPYARGAGGCRARGKRRGTRGGAKNRNARRSKSDHDIDGDGYADDMWPSGSAATTASPMSCPEHAPTQPVLEALPASVNGLGSTDRPRLQLKPRSTSLGEVGGMAEVSTKTKQLFGRN